MWENFYLSTPESIIFPDFAISKIAKFAINYVFRHKKKEETLHSRFLHMLDVYISLPVLFLFHLLVLESEFDMRYHFSKFLFSLLSNSFRCFVITGIRYRQL